jgi:murein endopeptidase
VDLKNAGAALFEPDLDHLSLEAILVLVSGKFSAEIVERGAGVAWMATTSCPKSFSVGGPMITGHASHQVGLDADVWLTPMPRRELTRAEREEMSATMVVADDRRDVDPKVWTPGHFAVIKAAASADRRAACGLRRRCWV